jgi:hypothetical protein
MNGEKRGRILLAAALLAVISGGVHEARRDGTGLRQMGGISVESARRVTPPSHGNSDVAGPPLTQARQDAVAVQFRVAPGELRDAVAGVSGGGASYSAAHTAFGTTERAARAAATAAPVGRLPGGRYAAIALAAPNADAGARVSLGAAGHSASSREPGTTITEMSVKRALAVASSGATTARTLSARPAALPPDDRLTPAERLFAAFPRRGPRGTTDAAPKEKASQLRQQRRFRKLRPALLSKLLGRGALKSPPDVALPKDKPWKTAVIPELGQDGRPVVKTPLTFDGAEKVPNPPACKRAPPHWERRSGQVWRHEKELFGRASQDGWAWARRGARSWLWPEPDRSPLLRHQGHWWLRSRELWFLLHEGAPWGSRFLREWGQLGFEHPSGAQMIYSADGTKVGMIEPGVGAIVYDALTGRELGRWSADQLPRKPEKNLVGLPPW